MAAVVVRGGPSDFEQLHPWQWLRDTVIRPVLGDG